MSELEEFKKFKDKHWMTTDHLLFEAQHRGNEAIAEVYRSLEKAEAELEDWKVEYSINAHVWPKCGSDMEHNAQVALDLEGRP